MEELQQRFNRNRKNKKLESRSLILDQIDFKYYFCYKLFIINGAKSLA